MSLPWFKGPTHDSLLGLPVRGVEVQPSKSLSESSPEPPTWHPGQITCAHGPTQMHHPGSFSSHPKSLVKNELVVAGTSSLPPPRAAISSQPAHHSQEVQPAPPSPCHPTTCLEITTAIQELQQHPGAGEEASAAEGSTGRPHKEMMWAGKCRWRSSGPISLHPKQGQPRSCCTSSRTSPKPAPTKAQPDLSTSQRKKKKKPKPFHSCIIHLFILAFTPSRLNLL